MVHIPHLINQSGSGITLDSVTEVLSKRSLYSFDTSIVVTRSVSLQIPFSRPIRATGQDIPLTHNQRYLLVHHKEDIRHEVPTTYIYIVTFISSYITIIEGQAILAESTPLYIARKHHQYHRGEEDKSGRAGELTLLFTSTEFDLHST